MEYYCLGENYASATLSLKFMLVVKLLSVAKSQNFVDISGVQKPAWAKILLEQKSTWGHIIFIHKSYNRIVDKIVFISSKTVQK